MKLDLTLLSVRLAICQLPVDTPVPAWTAGSGFVSVTRTGDELSIVCDETLVPDGVNCTKKWQAIKVEGPLGFDLIGILAELAGILARAGVSIFVISTYNTDYILVQKEQTGPSLQALQQAGHGVKLDSV